MNARKIAAQFAALMASRGLTGLGLEPSDPSHAGIAHMLRRRPFSGLRRRGPNSPGIRIREAKARGFTDPPDKARLAAAAARRQRKERFRSMQAGGL